MKIINPATGELIEDLAVMSPDELLQNFEAMRRAQRSWRTARLDDRLACIVKFDELLETHQSRLARELTQEMGKPLQESLNEIKGARYRIQYFLENSARVLSESVQHQSGNVKEVLRFEPLGVLCNISAWNYPFLVGVNVFIPALIAGNAVMYKPSEYASLTGLNIADLLHEAGVPEEIFTVVVGDGKTGEALCELDFDGYFFTGSYLTGKKIAEAVAPKLVPISLELGGKDPIYVCDDVTSVEDAAEALVEGAFYNNGQSCCAVERIYVHEKVYENFVDHFVKVLQVYPVGDPMQLDTKLGAIARPTHIDFLEAQIQDAVDKGGRIVCGGKRLKEIGAFFEPTVLTHVDHSMRVMTEETFGPLIGIMKVSSDNEALNLMLDTPYGLTAGVFSSDLFRAEKLLTKLDAGNVYLNCSDRVSPHLPWAGRKHSGLGATLSYLGILAFVNPKGYHLNYS